MPANQRRRRQWNVPTEEQLHRWLVRRFYKLGFDNNGLGRLFSVHMQGLASQDFFNILPRKVWLKFYLCKHASNLSTSWLFSFIIYKQISLMPLKAVEMFAYPNACLAISYSYKQINWPLAMIVLELLRIRNQTFPDSRPKCVPFSGQEPVTKWYPNHKLLYSILTVMKLEKW